MSPSEIDATINGIIVTLINETHALPMGESHAGIQTRARTAIKALMIDAARAEGRAEQVAEIANCSITDAQGVAWFEARFGVPIGDKPGAADVAALSKPIEGA